MYTIKFSGPDACYTAKARNRAVLEDRLSELKRMKVPVIAVMWHQRPRELHTLSKGGAYNRLLW